jgi:hypothetical protein
MTKVQFRVLYREFLFRMVDLEVLAAGADIVKLLGRFATALIFLSFMDALGALFFDASSLTPPMLAAVLTVKEHGLIARTMLVVGLFAVLSWDSTFPSRRDVLVLAPLPVRPRTFFWAKVAALGSALALAMVTLNLCTGAIWPLIFTPSQAGPFGALRSIGAYWITTAAAGTFIFCCVLVVQGLSAQLPRRRFLRVSAFLQIAALCLFLGVFFLQPTLGTPQALAEHQRQLPWLPTYWFLGLFRELSGTGDAMFRSLAGRAAAGLIIAVAGAAGAYLLAYFRTLRKIVEEPDLVPGGRGIGWSPRFGAGFETAIVLFSARTLMRSRQHRVVLAFYLGIGFALLILLMQTPAARRPLVAGGVSMQWLIGTFIVLIVWMAGTGAMFAVPLDLAANWIFRTTPIPESARCFKATRRALLVVAVAPVWAVSAVLLLASWPWWAAMGQLIVLALLGSILSELFLYRSYKIPFTCSFLPGKSPPHLMLLYTWMTPLLAIQGAVVVRSALTSATLYARLLAILIAVAVGFRWRSWAMSKQPGAETQFEDVETPYLTSVGLVRDGRMFAGD